MNAAALYINSCSEADSQLRFQFVVVSDLRPLVIKTKCVVDYTEKGWFIQYIDRDPETIHRQEAIKA